MPDSDYKTILMVDDDPEDCMLASDAFAESGANASFSCMEDAVELVGNLLEYSRSGEKKLPSLILLDLSMPRKDGRQLLVEIKSELTLRNIPIVVLTTSEEKEDADVSLKSGAAAFITKPATFDEWVRVMRSLAESYLS